MVHDRLMFRLTPILLLVGFSAFGQKLNLRCEEITTIIDQVQRRLTEIDARKRGAFGDVPLFFQGVGYSPLQFYEEGRETRLVAKVAMKSGLAVLKQFKTVAGAVSFAAQMNQLRSLGIDGVEVVSEVDMQQRIVAVQHHQLVSLEWLNEKELPSGFLPLLRRMRGEYADVINALGIQHQILDKRVDVRDIYVDLDSDTFRLIDIK